MIDINNYEQYALEYLDGELPPEIHLDFERFLEKHPEIQDQLDELYEMRTLPFLSFQYPNKQNLYKKEKSAGAFWLPWSIAASFLILVGVGLLYIMQNKRDSSFLSHVETNISERSMNTDSRNDENKNSNSILQERESPILSEKKKTDQVVKNQVKKSDNYFQEDDVSTQDELAVEFLDEKFIPIKEKEEEKILMDHLDMEVGENIELVTLVDPIPLRQFRLDHATAYPEVVGEIRFVKNQATKPRTIFIELPDEFFSESWRDLSLNNLKGKLFPDLFKTKSK